MGNNPMTPFLNKENLNGFFRYAMALTANKQDAEDLVHTGIERALKGGFSTIENKPAYIRTIIRNAWYDELRKQRIRNEVTTDLNDTAGLNEIEIPTSMLEVNPVDIIISEIELERVWGKLADQQREILYFWCVLGMTAAEMAKELKLPRGTVLSRIHRLKIFFQKLQDNVSEVQHD